MTVETRYLNVLSWTVNNLLSHKLVTAETVDTSNHSAGTSATLVTGYWAIDVAVRHADGSEDAPIGTKVAQISRSIAGIAYTSATWDCPQTVLLAGDSIVVRVYGKVGTGAWVLQGIAFSTEALGAQSLDAATWTVWYTVRIYYLVTLYQYLYYHEVFLSEDQHCQIDNFTWTPTAAVGIASKRLLVGVGL